MSKDFLKGLGAGLLLLVGGGLLGATWNSSWEAIPDGATALASDIDQFIKDVKSEVRQRAEVEHIWGGSTNDSGLHSLGSARCFYQAAAPMDINGGTAALGPYVSSSGTDASTLLTTTEPGGSVDIGNGRCWIDSDDNSLHVWDPSGNAWVPAVALTAANTTSVLQGSFNLLYNGDFEATTGDGTDTDDIPVGTVEIGTTATFAYQNTDTSEGEGLEVTVTAGADGDGFEWALTGLKASTQYKVVARVNANTGDVCRLHVDAKGGTDLANTDSTTTGSYETLQGVFTTDASQDADIELTGVSNGDICNWDHVAVYEIRDETAVRHELPQPGVAYTYDTDSSASTADGVLVQVSVNVPGAGYAVEVYAGTTLVCNNTNGRIAIRKDTSEVREGSWNGNNDGTYGPLMTLVYMEIPASVGTATYDLYMDEDTICTTDPGTTGGSVDEWIYAKVVPAR